MSDASSADAMARLFEEWVAPVLFSGRAPESSPVLTIIAGQPGSAPLRAAARVTAGASQPPVVLAGEGLGAFHPRLTESVLEGSEGARGEVSAAAAAWTRMALRRAREERVSLVLDGSRLSPGVAASTAGLFAADGFSTTIAVIAVPRAESLLATASRHLLTAAQGRWSPLATLEEHDAGFDRIAEIVRMVEANPTVDRLIVVGRIGELRFDAVRTHGPDSGMGEAPRSLCFLGFAGLRQWR